MLQHAFAALATRAGRPWPRADTGREILATLPGLGAGDAALAVVFRTAERSHFGSKAADAGDYRTCFDHYRRWRSSWPTTAP